MDIVTQGLLGAAVGFAVAGRRKPRAALALGFLGGLAPDFDIFFASSDSVAYWEVHRGITHSLFFGPVVGLALAGLSQWVDRRRAGDWSMGFALWYLFWTLVLVTHPLLDAMTIYGTQLLAPFSNQPFGVAGISIIDPLYSLPLLAVLIYAVFSRDAGLASRWNAGVLGLTTAYLLLSWAQNPRAREIAEADLRGKNIAFEQVEAYTTIFSPWLRRVMATDANGRIQVGFVSTLNPQPIRWQALPFDPEAEAIARTVAKTPEGEVFNRFANGPKVASFYMHPDGRRELRIADARYGFRAGPHSMASGASLSRSRRTAR